MTENKKTCLYDRHVALGALMQPFGGFIMPIQYSSIIEEHEAVRKDCGVFDVSHMGEVIIKGGDAEEFVSRIFTNDIKGAPDGKIFYGMMCHDDGGTVDDLLVYKMKDNEYFLVINAANIDKDWDWIQRQAKAFIALYPTADMELDHASDSYGQLAVQGPQSEAVMQEVLGLQCAELVFYTAKTIDIGDEQLIVSRTGYTGEDGFEIYGSHGYIQSAWDKLMESKRCKPCGLGCRDTLRFEVGLPLYGDELSEEISPVMAGLGMFVKLDKEGGFIGCEALRQQKENGTDKKLIGIELEDKAIPRHGYAVLKDGRQVGTVTTGYHCISVDKSVCMALVESSALTKDKEHWAEETFEVQIRKKTFAGHRVAKKFYQKHYKK